MSQKTKTKKDKFLETLAGNKLFLAALLILVLLARHYSRTVLNLPSSLIWSKYVVALALTITFFTVRFIKFNDFYIKKLKDWVDIVILFSHFVFLSTIFWLSFHVGLSFLIVKQTDDQPTTYNCRIVSDFTINEDRIVYSFKGKNYTIGIIHTQTSVDLRSKYCIRIEVTKSIFNSYILSSGQLYEKTAGTIISGD